MQIVDITMAKLEVDTYQHLINQCHKDKDYTNLQRHIKAWSVAIKKYNETVSRFFGEI